MSLYPHEQLLQILSAQLIELKALQRISGPPEALSLADRGIMRNGLNELERMAREALSLVRATLEEEPLVELENVTLAEALSRLTEATAEKLGLSSRISFSGLDEQGEPQERNLSTGKERLLFLVARETFYQMELRTGTGMRRLRLALNYGHEDVQMSIEDDGSNANVPTSSAGTTAIVPVTEELAANIPPFTSASAASEMIQATSSILQDLHTRMEQCGGKLEIQSLGESGTRVQARIPYEYVATYGSDIPRTPNEQLGASKAQETASVDSVRLLIVDSHAVTRAGLRWLLESYSGLQVIGEAADGVQAVSETLELGPQVVLMDAQLPEGQSLEALRQIKQLNLDTRVLLLATQDREEYLYETLRAGADGYVLKDIAPDELAQAVRAVARGEVLIQSQLAGRLLTRFGKQGRNGNRYETLTVRELEVLRLLARGLRNKEIASRLYVSERTVNFHLANIYQKLNVSGRTEALSKALEQGLISA